ncbi:hypothetical protein DKX38_003124 [Salix brachista]|uniref:Uncharacterized protein n=1 Tax=Salix brachista TaxID=2182728 RepID=A0A5N5NRU6_9ROSI|nr:hypothetical protein DKX38_003124 [Salix brachista]
MRGRKECLETEMLWIAFLAQWRNITIASAFVLSSSSVPSQLFVFAKSCINLQALERINTLIFWVQGAHSRDDQCIDCAAKGYVFFPRINVVSATGNMSLQKARVSEDNMVDRVGHLWFNFVLFLLL